MDHKVGEFITWNTANGHETAQICEISEKGYWVSVGGGKVVYVPKECVKIDLC